MMRRQEQFQEWMHSVRYREKTILQYSSAIANRLTKYAIQIEIININGSLLNITSPDEFKNISMAIKNANGFKETNETGHNLYSCSLDCYARFLIYQNASKQNTTV